MERISEVFVQSFNLVEKEGIARKLQQGERLTSLSLISLIQKIFNDDFIERVNSAGELEREAFLKFIEQV
tara:strand:+ start:639 stop:848 length:210 start_codon:yes stop_codon:yes gene_type:complete